MLRSETWKTIVFEKEMWDWLYKNGKTELTCSIMLRLCELNIELKFGENLKIWVPKEVVVFGKLHWGWRAEAPRVPCTPLTWRYLHSLSRKKQKLTPKPQEALVSASSNRFAYPVKNNIQILSQLLWKQQILPSREKKTPFSSSQIALLKLPW